MNAVPSPRPAALVERQIEAWRIERSSVTLPHDFKGSIMASDDTNPNVIYLANRIAARAAEHEQG